VRPPGFIFLTERMRLFSSLHPQLSVIPLSRRVVGYHHILKGLPKKRKKNVARRTLKANRFGRRPYRMRRRNYHGSRQTVTVAVLPHSFADAQV
jgi:hypothetical protein